MAGNNPFIRYKIYSTSNAIPRDFSKPGPEVRVVCYTAQKEHDQQPFLEKILSAAKIHRNEYHVVLLNPGDSLFASDQGWVGTIDHIFLFGLPATTAGIQLNPTTYTVNEIKGSKIILLPSLAYIESNKTEKQKLWTLLQNEFLND